MSELRLEELSATTIVAVNALSLKPGQEQFIAPTSYAVAGAVAKVRRPGGTTHLFVAAPNAFSFLLGQHADSMGMCAPYEFDFGGRVDGLYRPTFTI